MLKKIRGVKELFRLGLRERSLTFATVTQSFCNEGSL